MWIIDRYMLRQFFSTFVISLISLFGLYVVFDLFANLEDFLRHGKEYGGLLRLIAVSYGYRMVVFFDQTANLLALVAAMFTVTWIQRHNELTALMAAGVARMRVAAPVIGAAILIAFLAAASRELVTPRIRDALSRRPQDLVGNAGQKMNAICDNATDILFQGDCTYANEQRISKPSLHLPRVSPLDRYGQKLIAENAYYCPADGNRPAGYLFRGVSKPDDLAVKESLFLEGKPVLITPQDAGAWLKPNECFVVSGISFMQLAGRECWRAYSSTPELIAGLRNPSLDLGADVRVAIHSRMVQPLLDINILFLGLPLVVRRENRNVFLAIGLCAALVSCFMAVTMACRQLGTSYWVSPALGAWLPLFIFVPPAVVLTESMRQ